MPNTMSREAAAPQPLSVGPQPSGDSQEVQQLRMHLAQMQAQLNSAQQAASPIVPPSPQGASAVIVTENPFGFTKGEMVKLAMSCDPADLKGER